MTDRPRRPRSQRKRPEPKGPASSTARVAPPLAPSGAPPTVPPPPNGGGRSSRTLDGWALSAVGIVLLGFGLRFLSLGDHPLSPREAEHALQSLAVHRGEGAAAVQGPLLVYGQALIFLLFGASDASARLLPASLGTAVVALPLLLQRELGRLGARVACLLLAVSPTLVYFSRQADAAMVAASLAFAAICLYHVALRDSNRRALVAAVVALALLLTAGPLGYYALLAIAVYLFLRSAVGRSQPATTPAKLGFVGPAGPRLAGEPILTPALRSSVSPSRLLLVFAAAWALATTGILSDLQGVQYGLVDGLAGWLGTLVEATVRSPFYYVGVLVSYEQAALLFGLLGFVALRRDALAGRMAFWATLAFVVGSLSQSRPIGLSAQVAIPLAVLAGGYSDRLLRSLADPEPRRGLLAFAIGATIILAGLGIALSVFSNQDPPVTEALLAVPIVVGTIALAWSALRFGPALTWRYLAVVALAVTLIWGWRENSLLSYGRSANPAELLVEAATSPDARQLARDVSEIGDAARMGGRERGVLLAPGLPPTVAWYLRDTPEVEVGETLSSKTIVMVLPLESGAPAGYAGQRYQLGESAVPKLDTWKAIWRWYAYREAPGSGRSSDAMVNVRSIG